MDCNVCQGPDAEVTELGYKNGDTYKMYLCGTCRTRFISDTTIHRVQKMQAL